MGGAVSSGRDNDELIDNLMGGNYIRTRSVEKVFRALDRADYMTPDSRDQAYKDLAWQNGPLHMSAPCIYSEVVEGLELKAGLSFLNVGSGTGYLSTLVGLILGSSGISHGVEVHPVVIEYANRKMTHFLENSAVLDEFDFCVPKFYYGNGLCISPLLSPYDRVYCGAGCPEEYKNYFKQLIKVGGILVMPLNDNLVQVRRVSQTEWVTRSLLNVSFASLRVPKKEESAELIKLEEQSPPRLQALARAQVRSSVRQGLMRRHPDLREPPPRHPPAKKSCPRRICIPIDEDSEQDGLNALHDLNRGGGSQEMNALFNLVLSMGQNRVAGALRFDPLDSPTDSSDEDVDARRPDDEARRPDNDARRPDDDNDDDNDNDDDDDDDDDDGGADRPRGDSDRPSDRPADRPSDRHSDRSLDDHNSSGDDDSPRPNRSRRSMLTFEIRDMVDTATAAEGTPASSPKRNTATAENESNGDQPSNRAEQTNARSRVAKRRGRPIPAEVEIYMENNRDEGAGPSATGDMQWEECVDDEGEEGDCSSEGDTAEESTKSRGKGQKLDSGIGDETTPSSDSSPAKSDSKTDESDADGSRPSDSLSDDTNDDKETESRRRVRRRGGQWSWPRPRARWASREGGPVGGARGCPPPRRRCKRRATDGSAAEARRQRLSATMKHAVDCLPLPLALKTYVNFGRALHC